MRLVAGCAKIVEGARSGSLPGGLGIDCVDSLAARTSWILLFLYICIPLFFVSSWTQVGTEPFLFVHSPP